MPDVQPTNNPVPSDNPADARDNFKRIDEVVNSTENLTSPTRTGVQLVTLHRYNELVQPNIDGAEAAAVSAAASAAAAEAAVSGLDYQGLWPDSGGSANKGDTYQTQVSGTPTGLYFTALQNTTVAPVSDDVNWRAVVSSSSIGAQEVTSTGSTEPRTLSDRFADIVNVKDFGAVGDGVVDDTEAFRLAMGGAGVENVKTVYIPPGNYRITGAIVVNTSGCTIVGAGRTATRIEVYGGDVVTFQIRRNVKVENLLIQQMDTNAQGIAFGTPQGTSASTDQAFYCSWEDVHILGFKFGWWLRASLWLSWKNCQSNNLCGIRFARNGNPYDRTNPNAPGEWNQFSPIIGWFHNVGTIDVCNFEDDEVGIWGSCMSYSINSCTTQGQGRDPDEFEVLPDLEVPTGVWLESGAAGNRNSWGNVITNHYSEATKRPFKLEGQRSVIVEGGFVQGGPSNERFDTPLEAVNSIVYVRGLVGQDWFNWLARMIGGSLIYGDTAGAATGAIVDVDGNENNVWYRNNNEPERYTDRYSMSVESGSSNNTVDIPIAFAASYAVYEISVAGVRDGFASHMHKWQVFRFSSSINQIEDLSTNPDANFTVAITTNGVSLTWGSSASFVGQITVEEVSSKRHFVTPLTSRA